MSRLNVVMARLDGYKTYAGVVGFVGLAVYQISQGDPTSAMHSLLTAATMGGLRSAVAKVGAS